MALSKVGAAPGASAFHIGAGGTLAVVFTADTTFAEDDFLLCHVGAGALDSNQVYTPLPSEITVSSGWSKFTSLGENGSFQQNTPYALPVTHFVTSGEAGGTTVTLTVTLPSVSTVDGLPGDASQVGFIISYGGVAVRGGDTIKLEYIPLDDGDTDFAQDAFGTPKVATFSAVPPYDADWYSDTGGSILFYGLVTQANNGTAASTAWTGPTELCDEFHQDAQEAGATDKDFAWSSAYEILAGSADWPADSSSTSLTGSWNSIAVFRTLVVLDLSTPVEAKSEGRAPFEYVPSRVNVTELPHSVHTGMV